MKDEMSDVNLLNRLVDYKCATKVCYNDFSRYYKLLFFNKLIYRKCLL